MKLDTTSEANAYSVPVAAGPSVPIVKLHQSIRRWPSEESKAWTEHFVERMCSSPDVLAVVAFGSAVRQTETSQDIDLLYIFCHGNPQFASPPLDVDIRGYSCGEVDNLIATGHDLLGWSIRLGRLICERERYWSDLCARWNKKLPMPSSEVAEERAERSFRLYERLREMGDVHAAHEQLVSWLTHRARSKLIRADVFPASRPELPAQLYSIGELQLAAELAEALHHRV